MSVWDRMNTVIEKLNSTIFEMRGLRSEVSLPVPRPVYFALFSPLGDTCGKSACLLPSEEGGPNNDEPGLNKSWE